MERFFLSYIWVCIHLLHLHVDDSVMLLLWRRVAAVRQRRRTIRRRWAVTPERQQRFVGQRPEPRSSPPATSTSTFVLHSVSTRLPRSGLSPSRSLPGPAAETTARAGAWRNRFTNTGGFFDCLQGNSPTNQLAVSQVADWLTRGLVNSPTANHRITILYLHIKSNPNPNANPIEYWQRINCVICLK